MAVPTVSVSVVLMIMRSRLTLWPVTCVQSQLMLGISEV
jgi:hypothetical protein